VLKVAVKEAAQGKLVRYEIEFVSGSGEHITLDFSIKPLLNADGEVKLLIAEGRNISEIKKAKEEALETSRILLLQNKKLEEFAHITSHNLRAPIGNMMMLSNWLDNTTDTTEYEFLVKSLKESAQKTLNTIDVLAQTLRIHNEKKAVHETIFFEQTLQDVKQILTASIIEANAEIIQDFAECPQIQYPAIYMESILQNLLSNALKYRSLERECQIKIQTRWEQNRVALTFSDNGIGIDLTHNRDRIFGLYKTFHDNADARGVGLFLVKNQVEALGGNITVESTPNIGTTFTIVF
jgi:signal transduction histidine kinase